MKLELHYGKEMVRWELEKIVIERKAPHVEQYCTEHDVMLTHVATGGTVG